jgi:hypothetical protein
MEKSYNSLKVLLKVFRFSADSRRSSTRSVVMTFWWPGPALSSSRGFPEDPAASPDDGGWTPASTQHGQHIMPQTSATSHGWVSTYLCHQYERHQGSRLVPRHWVRLPLVGAREAASRGAPHPLQGPPLRVPAPQAPRARELQQPRQAPQPCLVPAGVALRLQPWRCRQHCYPRGHEKDLQAI